MNLFTSFTTNQATNVLHVESFHPPNQYLTGCQLIRVARVCLMNHLNLAIKYLVNVGTQRNFNITIQTSLLTEVIIVPGTFNPLYDKSVETIPLENNCLADKIFYQAEVITEDIYLDSCETPLKQRYRNHKASLNNIIRRKDT